MSRRVLVTTALEGSWPADGEVVFLGEWCRLHEHRQRITRLRSYVIPYHWDDRVKLRQDADYLEKLNECLIREMGEALNLVHGEDHDVRYWRFVLGYWVNLFVAAAFDRWEMIQRASREASITESYSLDIPQEEVIVSDTLQFNQAIVDDPWNHAFFCELLRRWTKIPVRPASTIKDLPRKSYRVIPGLRSRIINGVRRGLAQLLRVGSQSEEFMAISTYLERRDELSLQWRLGVPRFWRSADVVPFTPDWKRRGWPMPTNRATNEFEMIVRALIPRYLPTVFLEGYRHHVELGGELGWPRQPRSIFTSCNHFSDDVFKLYVARQRERGCTLIIGEHGGFIQQAFNGAGAYQLKVADAFLSWGWEEPGMKQVVPVGMLKLSRKPKRKSNDGSAMMVLHGNPRYGFDTRAMASAGQMLSYFEDQYAFVDALPEEVRSKLLVRLYLNDFRWSQRERWRDRWPDIQLDSGTVPMMRRLRSCRLFIATYNATTYLESLAVGAPTIMFWDPRFWEIRDSAKPFFAELKRVGIFHETPGSAARQVASIWSRVEDWWMETEVRDAVAQFTRKYCDIRSDLVPSVERVMRTIARPGSAARA